LWCGCSTLVVRVLDACGANSTLGVRRRHAWCELGPRGADGTLVVLRPLLERSGRHHADWLALRNITKKVGSWSELLESAMTRFATLYEDRFTKPAV
jgi:hypothetical protein